jgi:formate-dependent nitrite reductase cytochrome c552 subunit
VQRAVDATNICCDPHTLYDVLSAIRMCRNAYRLRETNSAAVQDVDIATCADCRMRGVQQARVAGYTDYLIYWVQGVHVAGQNFINL